MKTKWILAGLVLLFSSSTAIAETCYSRCAFVAEYTCEDGAYVGFCLGFWGCDAGVGAHECGQAIDSRALGSSCTANTQCASGKCEKGECVCKKDSDCPSGNCKKPLFKKNYCA